MFLHLLGYLGRYDINRIFYNGVLALKIKYKIRRIFVKIFTIFIEFISNPKRQLMTKKLLDAF